MNSSASQVKSNQETTPSVPVRITLIDCIKLNAERYFSPLTGEQMTPVLANEGHYHVSTEHLLKIMNEALEIIGDNPFGNDEE